MISIEKIFESRKSARVLRLNHRNKELMTPAYFPAVSGAEVVNPIQLMYIIMHSSYPRMLISAYDLSFVHGKTKKKLIGELCNYVRSTGFVMFDSGVFESFWKNDKKWTFKKYASIISKMDTDFYFAYDSSSNKILESKYLKSLERKISSGNSLNKKSKYIPIIHASDPTKLVSLIRRLVDSHSKLDFVAVTERDCGITIMERARTILKLREIMDHDDTTRVLHILGCGNPLSLATYVYCGADTFDSSDWYSLIIKPYELTLYDISQLELVNCKCEICQLQNEPFDRALSHNLLFYQKYLTQIQRMIRDNTLFDFLLHFLGKDVLTKISK